VMALVCRVRVRFCSESVRSGVWVSGVKMMILLGFEGVGVISIASVVALWSSRLGCIRQYLLLESSQRSMLASRSWARAIASFWRSALALRSSL